MGNTVASEGEDLADSPRVAPGEIPEKKKPKSLRKRIMRTFKKSKPAPTTKKNFESDEENEKVENPIHNKQAIQRRQKYYKNIGISKIGSGESNRGLSSKGPMNSTLDMPLAERESIDKNFTSFSSLAVNKAKAIASKNENANEPQKPLKRGKSSENFHKDIISEVSENQEFEPMKISPKVNDPEDIATMQTKNSLAESKADDVELTEETKIVDEENKEEDEKNADEEFKLNFVKNLQEKSMNDMRKKFLWKLTHNKIWLTQNEKPKSHQTWIIFDWDDTLLCTTFLNPTGGGCFDLPLNVKVQLKKLEKAAFNILNECLKHGDVYIITNAAEGWVEFSTRKYLPRILKVLDRITVISARACCEEEFPDEVHQWKMKAFLKTQEKMEKGAITNLVALGDSQFEMDAVKNLAAQFPRALIKTVKFREIPTPDELVKQINLVSMKLDQIWTSAKNLTIRLERKESE